MSTRLRAVAMGAGRLLATVIIAVAAAQTATVQLREQTECKEPCPGDTSDHDCPPTCLLCKCCSPLRTLAPTPVLAAQAPVSLGPVRCQASVTPTSPEPHEIFHVPKALLD